MILKRSRAFLMTFKGAKWRMVPLHKTPLHFFTFNEAVVNSDYWIDLPRPQFEDSVWDYQNRGISKSIKKWPKIGKGKSSFIYCTAKGIRTSPFSNLFGFEQIQQNGKGRKKNLECLHSTFRTFVCYQAFKQAWDSEYFNR